ncbi:MAG: hypothetical protein ABFC94_15690 [Syntrophomonas sp.]
MCEHGNEIMLDLTIPAYLSHTGRGFIKSCGIDACIAPIVKALNDGGIYTITSCCGHGKEPGSILLADGYEILIIAPESLQNNTFPTSKEFKVNIKKQ